MKKRCFIITLQDRKELENQAEERKVDEISSPFNDDDCPKMVPTKAAKYAQSILDKSVTVLSLEERKELEKQAEERKVDEVESLFSDDDHPAMVPTEAAEYSRRILNESITSLSLEERKELEKQAEERKVDEVESLFSDDGHPAMVPTEAAKYAQSRLDESVTTLSLEERKALEKQAKEREKSEYADLFDNVEEAMVPTQAARYAQSILNKSATLLTLEEKAELEEQSKEKEPDEVSRLFDDGNEMKETEEAKKAKNILSTSTLMLGASKLIELAAASEEVEKNQATEMFGYSEMKPTDRALEAKNLLNYAAKGIKTQDKENELKLENDNLDSIDSMEF